MENTVIKFFLRFCYSIVWNLHTSTLCDEKDVYSANLLLREDKNKPSRVDFIHTKPETQAIRIDSEQQFEIYFQSMQKKLIQQQEYWRP